MTVVCMTAEGPKPINPKYSSMLLFRDRADSYQQKAHGRNFLTVAFYGSGFFHLLAGSKVPAN